MAITPSQQRLSIGDAAPPFSDLMGTDGHRHSLDDFAEARALLVVFTCNHCPVAQAYEDRLIALQADYEHQGFALVAINPNDAESYPDDSLEAMQKRAANKGFNFPYLIDSTQQVARAYHAACTPDPFLFDAARRLAYNGRIDDDWKDSTAVRALDMRKAIERVLGGESIDFPVEAAMGCSIKWKPEA